MNVERDSIVFVHPVCDQDVVAGNSTIGMEIASWLQEQDETANTKGDCHDLGLVSLFCLSMSACTEIGKKVWQPGRARKRINAT